jgi:hypothetical protein
MPPMDKVYKNSYQPPNQVIETYHEDTPEDEYDHNFVFEVKALKSERVELRPFIVNYCFCRQAREHLAN